MYLLISVFLFIPWGLIYYYKPNLRSRIVKSSLFAAPFGIINMWFRIDYWHAPEVFFFSFISLEDILFAFVTTGISFTIFDALFTVKEIKSEKPRKHITLLFIPIIISSFFILNNGLGINSMFMWAIPMLVLATVIVIIRRDLLVQSIVSALILTLFSIPIYMFLFNYLSPDFWDTYWYLSGTKYGITVFGNVPVLELLWYFSWASFCGVVYHFTRGTKKVLRKF